MCNFCSKKSSKVTFSLHEQFDLLTWDYAGETHFSMIYISLMLQNLGAFQFWANISITFIFLKRWLFRIGIFHGWHHSDKLLCSFWVISMGINSIYIYIFYHCKMPPQCFIVEKQVYYMNFPKFNLLRILKVLIYSSLQFEKHYFYQDCVCLLCMYT